LIVFNLWAEEVDDFLKMGGDELFGGEVVLFILKVFAFCKFALLSFFNYLSTKENIHFKYLR